MTSPADAEKSAVCEAEPDRADPDSRDAEGEDAEAEFPQTPTYE